MKLWFLRVKLNLKIQTKKQNKKDVPKNLYEFLDGSETFLDAFESRMLLIKMEHTRFSDPDCSNLKQIF